MGSPIVIGVAGGSGSGKTTLVASVARALGPRAVTVIHHDSYYRDRGGYPPREREKLNYDHPDSLDSRLLASHLKKLRAGAPVTVPVYDFKTHLRRANGRRVAPGKAIILEGMLIYAEKELRDLIDIKFFIDADDDIRFIRRMGRDMRSRGRGMMSVVSQYLGTVRPMHADFVVPSRRHADVILPWGATPAAAAVIAACIRSWRSWRDGFHRSGTCDGPKNRDAARGMALLRVP